MEATETIYKAWKKQERGAYIGSLVLMFSFVPAIIIIFGAAFFMFFFLEPQGLFPTNENEKIYTTKGEIIGVAERGDIVSYQYKYDKMSSGFVTADISATKSSNPNISYSVGDKVIIEYLNEKREESAIAELKSLPLFIQVSNDSLAGDYGFLAFLAGILAVVFFTLFSPFFIIGLVLYFKSRKPFKTKEALHLSGQLVKGEIVLIENVFGDTYVAYKFVNPETLAVQQNRHQLANLDVIANKKAGDEIEILFNPSTPKKSCIKEIV